MTAGRSRPGTVRPIAALGLWVIALMAVTVVLGLVSAFADWVTLADFERSWAEQEPASQEWSSNSWLAGLGLLMQSAAAVVFIVWLWRARRNAEALCGARHRLAAGWVIGGWICPVVNVWFPHVIVADVVRASDPQTPSDLRNLRSRPTSRLVTAWWLLLLSASALSMLALVLGLPKWRAETTGDYIIYGYGPVGGFGLIAVEFIHAFVLAAAGTCLAVVITRVRRWQENRSDDQAGATASSSPSPTQHVVSTRSALTPTDIATVTPAPRNQDTASGPTSPSTPGQSIVGSGTHILPLREADPSTLGPYTITGRLGADSVGEIYVGRNGNTEAVVRALHAHHVADRAELARTFTAAAAVRSDFVASVLDSDADASPPWIASEYTAGPTLHDLVTDHATLSATEATDLALGIADALAAIHDAGLIHGGLTPKSVVFTDNKPHVTDFGVPIPRPESSAYSAPEQLTSAPAAAASDVFALGAILAYALTGRPPFGDSTTATLLHRMTTQPPDLKGVRDAGLRFIITGCLAELPDVRLTTTQILGHLRTTPSPRPTLTLPPSKAATGTSESTSEKPTTPPASSASPVREAGASEAPVRRNPSLSRGVLGVGVLAAVLILVGVVAVFGLRPVDGHPTAATAPSPVTIPVKTTNLVTVSQDGRWVYVAGYNEVSVVDTTTDTVTAVIEVPWAARGLAISPDGARLYVNTDEGLVAIDTTTRTAPVPLATWTGDELAGPVLIAPDGRRLYAVHAPVGYGTTGPRSMTVVDVVAGAAVAAIPLDDSVVDGAQMSPDGHNIYLFRDWKGRPGGSVSEGITIVDTATNSVTVDFPLDLSILGGRTNLATSVSRDGRYLYLPSSSPKGVTVFDLQSGQVTETLPTDAWPTTIATSPNGRYLFTCGMGSRSSIDVIDLAAKRSGEKIATARSVDSIATSPDGRSVYAFTHGESDLVKIDVTRFN
ncbi:DUF4328 domain-containing protein [Nocardia cyriacigeorgica]|uniref:DUF4328 domain-containing protein n=1 Tax=Nocardia cyriacigeorgica TaxID=135487 RepID=A0A5R8P9H6_9NOCA|nr:DUF4328 domain-containing protein [Nocardia cyriacigeorgica]TLF98293.1 DUF4328 domain-containing protein [Nocardia cyriacigeorgica]